MPSDNQINTAREYPRSFKIGRSSELLYNEELHKIYESIKHLLDNPYGKQTPMAKIDGAMWHDRQHNELKWFDKVENVWRNYYDQKFKITDYITSDLPPGDPVKGELWIHDGVLCYFDGIQWTPIKALMEDGSQFSLDVFKNFLLISPLWKIGHTIVEAKELEAFNKKMAEYLQGVLDTRTGSFISGDGSKYQVDNFDDCNYPPKIPVFKPEDKCQLLVPNIDFGRIFIDHKLDHTKYEELSKVCIQYHCNDLAGKTPSLIHLNPGRLSHMSKTLFKVDRQNPFIPMTAENAEYYGFTILSQVGDLLLPDEANTPKDYTITDGGIILSYDACQNYEYVLVIKYEFSSIKTSGRMQKINTHDKSASYYIEDFNGPINVFIEGLDLEQNFFDTDSLSQTITINDDNVKNLEIGFMHTPNVEYGYVRQVDLMERGVLRLLRDYHTPLLFINGEAIYPPNHPGLVIEENRMFVPEAKIDMMWSVVDLYDSINKYNAFYGAGSVETDGVIHYDEQIILDTDDVILFVDGLLIKKEEIDIDRTAHTITVPNIQAGQEYILLRDKYHWLYQQKQMLPALEIGYFDDTLVYFNGNLMCNDTALDTFMSETTLVGKYNEIKCFKTIHHSKDNSPITITKSYKIWNIDTRTWDPLQQNDIKHLLLFCYGYTNMPRSIKINIPYSNTDDVQVYAFNQSNKVEHPLIVRSVDVHDTVHIETVSPYPYGKNGLRVYCDGIRIYPDSPKYKGIKEYIDGNSFDLPEPFTGKVTYIIEQPNAGEQTACDYEILDNTNAFPNTVNVFKTSMNLFPGRISVYVNGIRLPAEAFTIMDNTTLSISNDFILANNSYSFPDQKILANNNIVTIRHKIPDCILIEKRQDNRIEKTITVDSWPYYNIDTLANGIDDSLLATKDEILIFINGLFFGLTSLDGYIKQVDMYRLQLTDTDALSVINQDELYEYFIGNKLAYQKYLLTTEEDSYEHQHSSITLEWH